MIEQKSIAEAYQPLFDFMTSKYGVTLLQSEMDDIIYVVDKVNENLTELYRLVCDVDGCYYESCSQGMYWRETGYWCVCHKHSSDGREGKEQPKMKQEAIEREEKRKLHPDGYLS